MRFAFSCLWLVAACTTIDDGFGLEIQALGAPIVVVQDGDGPWERVETTTDGRAFVQIHGATYGVGRLCTGEEEPSAAFQFDTHPHSVLLPCPISIPASATFHVRGSTAPMATVWIDGRSVRADASGAFDMTLIQQGVHDVVAILPTTPPQIVARRGIAITGHAHVDLPASDGVEMTALYPTVVGTHDDLELSADLNTGTDWISFGTGRSAIHVPPASFFVPTDHPAVAAHAGHCTRQRPLADAREPLELPSHFDYAIDRSRATWSDDPDIAWDTAFVDVAVGTTLYRASVSASWRAVTQTSSIPIVNLRSLPGWTDGLPSFTPSEPASFTIWVSRGRFDGDFTRCAAGGRIDRW